MNLTLGKRLKELREDKDLSRKELANILGIGYYALAKYETDEREPELSVLKKFTDFFNVSLDYLVGNVETKNLDEIRFIEKEIKSGNIKTLAAHRTDNPMDDLPEPARKSVEEFIEFVKRKYEGEQ